MAPPSKYNKVLADEICFQLAQGIPLRQICRQEGIPRRTIYDWMWRHKEFEEALSQARIPGYDAIADEALEIADDARNDWMDARRNEGDEAALKFDGEHVQRSKLRVETRLKLLAKWDPKRYGEKLALGGADDLPPIKQMTDEQLLAKIAALQKMVDEK